MENLRKKDTLEEIDLLGERVMYYPYIDPPTVRVNSYTTRKVIGELENGDQVFQYETDNNEWWRVMCQNWLAARKATNDTVPIQA